MAEKNMSGMGKLVIQTTTARDSLPVAGASVSITQPETGAPPTLLHYAVTDRSGRTPIFDLPAPPRSESLQPGTDTPYARYTVQVEHPAYQPVSIVDVTIFDRIASTLPVFLIPIIENSKTPETIEVIPPPPIA